MNGPEDENSANSGCDFELLGDSIEVIDDTDERMDLAVVSNDKSTAKQQAANSTESMELNDTSEMNSVSCKEKCGTSDNANSNGTVTYDSVFKLYCTLNERSPADESQLQPQRDNDHKNDLHPEPVYVGEYRSLDGQEYIKIKVPISKKVDQLGFSARVNFWDINIKLHHEGCLLTADNNFVAKVRIQNPAPLHRAYNFRHAKGVLLSQLRIVNVLIDHQKDERERARKVFYAAIKHTMLRSTANRKHASDCIQLAQLMEKLRRCSRMSYRSLCIEILRNRVITDDTKRAASELLKLENDVFQRDKHMRPFGVQVEDETEQLLHLLNKLSEESVKCHTAKLLEKSPDYLQELLKGVCQKRIMLITYDDVKLFADMSSILQQELFQNPLENLAKRWIEHIKSIKIDHFDKEIPPPSPIYFFLCKSLEELIVEISSQADIPAADLLVSDNEGWHPVMKISWKSENTRTKCLEREYYFIFRLLKHYDISRNTKRGPFDYNAEAINSSENKSMWETIWSRTKRIFINEKHVASPNPFGVPDELYVWYCLLHDVLKHTVPEVFVKAETGLDVFEGILQNYIKFMSDIGLDQLETLRIMTHNMARFIVQTIPCLIQQGSLAVDKQVLRKQLDVFNSIAQDKVSFRDLGDVFNHYWRNRNEIVAELPTKIDLPEMNSIVDSLLTIACLALDKKVIAEQMIGFFRAFNDFLVDLNDVQFDWFIKSIPNADMEILLGLSKTELITNKWCETENKTFRVTKPAKFGTLIPVLFDDATTPKHYVIDIIETLLSYITLQLQKDKWTSGEAVSQQEQISTTSELIFAVRNSLMYLKEQPDYVSFESFWAESIKPFSSVVDSSTSQSNFSCRVRLIKESFWYIRKQNEMDIDKALELFTELNPSSDDQLLRNAYQLYLEHFEQFMQISVDDDVSDRIESVVETLTECAEVIHFNDWDESFKQKKVPRILAGLAAVWSVLVSEDVSGTGRYIKPHCIQILCILMLMSVDKVEKGVANHLAQVLTGQGKSLVLGLSAALLALTGHKIRIVCYNQYLVDRDSSDFEEFLYTMGVQQDVTYGTFEDMADAIITPEVDGVSVGLRTLVSDLLLKHVSTRHSEFVSKDLSKSILLIDEVDVFFTKEFYGNQCCPVSRFSLPGLDEIQELIWALVNAGHDYVSVEEQVKKLITSEEFAWREDFGRFLDNKFEYQLLVEENKTFTQKVYTNSSFFNEELRIMITHAIYVYQNGTSAFSNKFRLSSTGLITYLHRGEYGDWSCGYYNMFYYFLLKKTNFVPTLFGQQNYGYLEISCGSLAYALLPKNYPLIIGVTGTLTALNEHEKRSIEGLYSIRQSSILPSFFGCSNLKFNSKENFHHCQTRSAWMNAIFSHSHAAIGSNRAVIIFFKTDTDLKRFRAEYWGQFDRLNELTENTEAERRELIISESGVAKTITLATRGMGRGVDYKSSVAVEKNGGVHVIQSFFSLDVKEETQIKGRTARKDNQGSYELIVCHQDLAKLLDQSKVTYSSLNAARIQKTSLEHEEIVEKISEATVNHELTLEYMRSFFSA